jgi:DtxR family manganese transport transcriptional regulator
MSSNVNIAGRGPESGSKRTDGHDRPRRIAPGLTPSAEDYLAAIREIREETGGPARQIDIAARMGFKQPSVTRGLRTLEQKGFVTIDLRRDDRGNNNKVAYLTDAGRALAERLRRRRQNVAAFLKSLGIPEADALAEAHLWEHCVSDETTDAMEARERGGRRKTVPAAPAILRQRRKRPNGRF